MNVSKALISVATRMTQPTIDPFAAKTIDVVAAQKEPQNAPMANDVSAGDVRNAMTGMVGVVMQIRTHPCVAHRGYVYPATGTPNAFFVPLERRVANVYQTDAARYATEPITRGAMIRIGLFVVRTTSA